nr:IS66 family insertion sequence hypothetical protein [Pseudorhizobium flavum]
MPALITPGAPPREEPMVPRGRMEVVSLNGRRVIIDHDVDIDALLRIVRGLETLL